MERRFSLFLAALLCFAACNPANKEDDNPEQSVTVTLSVNPTSLEFTAGGSTQTFQIVTNSESWKISSSADWATVSATSGKGNQTISVTVGANPGDRRQLTLTVADQTGSKKTAGVTVTQAAKEWEETEVVPIPDPFDGNKLSSTTYQLLIYSFADSDGDGIGDFKGIQNKLDYLDAMGVTALWLSPAHPTSSYHAYDVNDYYHLNPQYAVGEKTSAKAEADFQELLDAAHAKGIKIYMDYVLNHSGKNNAWFQEALTDPSSPYRDYYFFSSNPSSDYSKFPMLKGTSYVSGEWKSVSGGSPKLTISETSEGPSEPNCDWNLYLWDNAGEKPSVRFTKNQDGSYSLVTDINGTLGILVRRYSDWREGSKFGAIGGKVNAQVGQTLNLVADGGDISFTGNGRYKFVLSNVSSVTEALYYMGCFDGSMPDLNYGDVTTCEDNACFKDLAASADKWIDMGVDGFRLDAVKHICGGIWSYNNDSNRTFLKKWYEHCNATYKAAGHSDDIFMVGEVWSSHSEEQNYYTGITSCFEFEYWPLLCNALNSKNASSYASTVAGFVSDHTKQRPDAITSLFLTNHDKSSVKYKVINNEQVHFYRAADDLGRDLAKEKQAAAMLLTSAGKPFIYQGEELGYWRNDTNNDDDYLRAPIVWNSGATEVAKGWTNKLDNKMLTGSISVETQEADAGSLLNVYKTWSRLRNTYPALASGKMEPLNSGLASVAAWYMTFGDQKLLVIHNVGTSKATLVVPGDSDKPVALLGTATLKGSTLSLGANSSVVFEL